MARPVNGSTGTMKFKVERGIGIPNPHLSLGKKYEFPFGTMKVGECFTYPLSANAGVIEVQKTRGLLLRHAAYWRVTGRRFATRVLPGRKGVGCWRIA